MGKWDAYKKKLKKAGKWKEVKAQRQKDKALGNFMSGRTNPDTSRLNK